MKKIFSYIGAIAATAICFSACQKEVEDCQNNGQTHTVVFTAEATKTMLGDGKAEWLDTDKGYFHVFEDGNAATSTTVEINGQGKAVVTATFEGSAAGSHTYTGFVASSISGSGNPKVLTEQTTTSQVESYDPAADILFAKPVTGENLTNAMFQYKRVVAINKMTLQGVLEGETVNKVTIAGDKSIAGSYNKSTEAYSANDKTIVVNTDAQTVYFISGKAEGVTLTVTVNTDKAVYTKTFAKTIDLVAGSLHGFTVTYGPEHRKAISTDVYKRVSNVSELVNGDIILLVDETAKKASGTKSGDFLSAVDAEIEGGKLTPVGDVEQITLKKDGDNWKLSTAKGFIGATAAKQLAYNAEAQTWTISIADGGDATVASTNSSYGRFLYNDGSPRFLNYATSTGVSKDMRLPQIYKLDDGKTPLDAPVVTLNVDETALSVTVSWDAVPNASGYTVSCTGKDDVTTSSTSALFTGLAMNTEYTVTVKANGSEKYRESSASKSFIIMPSLKTIAEIFAKAEEVKTTATDVRIKFDNWVVSGASGSNVYVTDGTNGFTIYQSSHGFVKGDILSGTADCKVQLRNGAAQITGLTSKTEGLTVTKGGNLEAKTVTIANLSGVNTGAFVCLKGLTCKSSAPDKAVMSDGTNEITLYKTFITLPELTVNAKYDVTGVFIMYNTTKELAPLSAEDIEEAGVVKYNITIDPNIQHGSVSTTPASKAEAGATVLLSAAGDYGYVLKSWNVTKTASGTPITVNDNSFTMPAEAVTVSATFEEGDPDIPVELFDFSKSVSGWGTSYTEHTVNGTSATVKFTSANLPGSGQAIEGIPVTKGSDIIVVLKGYAFVESIDLLTKQWSSKENTVTLHTSTDGGKNYTKTSYTTAAGGILSATGLVNVNAFKFTFSSENSQIGIAALALNGAELPKEDASWDLKTVTVAVGADEKASVNTNYDGTLSVKSNNTAVATATVSGKTFTVHGVAEGTTTLTVTGPATKKFNAISKTVNVTVIKGGTVKTLEYSNGGEGWTTVNGGAGSGYTRLTESTHYITSPSFTCSQIVKVEITERKFGGPSDSQAKTTCEFGTTTLGTVTPSNTTLTLYTVTPAATVSGTGKVTVSNKGASGGKGAGVSKITIYYYE